MGKNLSAIRATIKQFLRAEFDPDIESEWVDDELDIYIQDCLETISEKRPYEVKDITLTTTANSKELDISSITDLLKVEKVEYPVGNEPPDYRNCSVFGTTLRFNYDYTVAGGKSIYLYCWKLHQLTESSSTLSPQIERVLVLGVCAKAATAKARTLINKINVGGANVATALQAWSTEKLALYRDGLRQITKQRGTRLYPTS